MQVVNIIFSFCGGLAIFLFGIEFMSDGLKNLGSNTFRNILQKLTDKRIKGILVGTGITCLIQSSSATSVMVVGFINAGLLQLSHGMAVVLGADIGTTITSWVVSLMGFGKFDIAGCALPVIAVGFFITFIAKSRKTKVLGQCLLGFGFLFLGLGLMSTGLNPLKESHAVKVIFSTFGKSPLLGIIVGVVFTMIIQSSSVSIAIVQVMALNGLLGLDAALGLVIGAAIGTTITAQLAALNGTKNARAVAMGNSLFKIVGAIIFFPLLAFGFYGDFLRMLIPGHLIMMQIAAANTIFILTSVLIFSTILWKPLLKFSNLLAFGKKDEIDREAKYLDPLFINDPPIAIQQVGFELIRMIELAQSAVRDVKTCIFSKKGKKMKSVKQKEDVIDNLQQTITSYLIKVSANNIGAQESKAYPVLLHCVNDIEKVGDYAELIATYAEEKISKKYKFGYGHILIIDEMFVKVDLMFDKVIEAMRENDVKAAKEALQIDNELDFLKVRCRENYLSRISKQKADPQLEVIVMDTVAAVMKIGDHLVNVADAMTNDLQWKNKKR
jgi:phosphate:Na+ symporter